MPVRACRRDYGMKSLDRPTGKRMMAALLSPRPETQRRNHDASNDYRHGKHRFHVALLEPGYVDDAGAGLLLWRACRTQERAGDHDSKLCVDGLDYRLVVGVWILG